MVLGIDPGLATLGYGAVKKDGRLGFCAAAFGVVTTKATDALPLRLQQLYISVQDLITKYQPRAVAVEELFFSRNTATAMTVAQARGVILLAAQAAGISLYEYTPMQIKRAVTGYGHAEKHQVQFMVQKMLKLNEVPKPDDAADALAIALCHHQTGLAGGFAIQ